MSTIQKLAHIVMFGCLGEHNGPQPCRVVIYLTIYYGTSARTHKLAGRGMIIPDKIAIAVTHVG